MLDIVAATLFVHGLNPGDAPGLSRLIVVDRPEDRDRTARAFGTGGRPALVHVLSRDPVRGACPVSALSPKPVVLVTSELEPIAIVLHGLGFSDISTIHPDVLRSAPKGHGDRYLQRWTPPAPEPLGEAQEGDSVGAAEEPARSREAEAPQGYVPAAEAAGGASLSHGEAVHEGGVPESVPEEDDDAEWDRLLGQNEPQVEAEAPAAPVQHPAAGIAERAHRAGFGDRMLSVLPGNLTRANFAPGSKLTEDGIGKAPAKRGPHGWVGLKGWEEPKPCTLAEARSFDRWGANVGVRLGDGLVCIDIDVKVADGDPAAPDVRAFADSIAEHISRLSGVVPLRRVREGSTSTLIPIRYKGLRPVWTSGKFVSGTKPDGDDEPAHVELLPPGRGAKQVVLWGVHASGATLEWSPRDPADIGRGEACFPELDEAQLRDVLDRVREGLAAVAAKHGWPQQGASTEATAGALPGTGERGEQCSVEELRGLLALIPNDYDDRDKWAALMHAIYGASSGSPEGREIALEWSAQWTGLPKGADKKDDADREPERFWDTINAGAVRSGVGMLRQEAQRRNATGYAALTFPDEMPEVATASSAKKSPAQLMADEIIKQATEGGAPVPGKLGAQGVTLDDFLAQGDTFTSDPEIIEGFVTAGQVHLFTAAPGAGKSALLVHAATCGLSGISPRDSTKSVPPCNVVALFGEDDTGTVQDRVKATRDNFAKAGTGTGLLYHVVNDTLRLADFDSNGKLIRTSTLGLVWLCGKLLEVLERHKAHLAEGGPGEPPIAVLLDMLRHFAAVNKNEGAQANAVGDVLKATMLVFERYGGPPIGFAFSMHDTKSAAREGKAGSVFTTGGAVEWEGFCRKVTRLTKKGHVITATVTKANNSPHGVSETWEVVPVRSRYPGRPDTFYLQPATASKATHLFEVQEAVAKLYGIVSADPGTPVLKDDKPLKDGSRHETVENLLGGEYPLGDAEFFGEVWDRAISLGAFIKGRHRKKASGDDREALKIVPGWTPDDAPEDEPET